MNNNKLLKSAVGEKYSACWQALVQAEVSSEGNVEVVHQVMANHLDSLNEGLIPVIKKWTQAVLAEYPDESKSIAALVENLSISFYQFPLGSRGDNLEIAIAGYHIVLTIHRKENNPKDWAMTMNNLATAYYSRIRGDRRENIEGAIAAYKEVLEVRTKTALPVEWATTMMNLATAYYSRIRGDRGENIEVAIAAYEEVLTVITKTALPVEWATTMNNLAIAYSYRIKGDRGENIEVAIAAYEEVLTVITKTTLPVEWATTMMNLATAYQKRIRGDRGENIEEGDDLDKKDTPVIQDILEGSLDLFRTGEQRAFLMTGRGFTDLQEATLNNLGIFAEDITLDSMSSEDLRQIAINYLNTVRTTPRQDPDPFTEEVMDCITNYAQGNPRQLNCICDKILRKAAVEGCDKLDSSTFEPIWKEVQKETTKQLTPQLRKLLYVAYRSHGISEDLTNEQLDELNALTFSQLIPLLKTLEQKELLLRQEDEGGFRFLPSKFFLPDTD